MTDTSPDHFDAQLSVVSQAINTASGALAQGKICDLTPLGEMIDDLCAIATRVVETADDAERERVGRALEGIAERMEPLEDRLRQLIAETGDYADGEA